MPIKLPPQPPQPTLRPRDSASHTSAGGSAPVIGKAADRPVMTTAAKPGSAATPEAPALPAAAPPSKASPKDMAKVLGDVTTTQEARYDYNRLGKPRNVDHAFDTLLCSSTGKAQIRRFGDENTHAWNMVLDLARKAEKSFDFSFFTIEQDPYGHAFVGAALYAQMRGVQVTGVTDWSANSRGRGFVSFGRGYDYLQEIAAFGGKVGVFNTPSKRAASLMRHGLNYGLIGCDHDKVIVIDKGTNKAEGETGGRNIGGAYHQDPKDNAKAWRDDTLHVKGKEACEGFAVAIEREFAGQAMKMVEPDRINFTPRARSMLTAYALMEEWVARPVLTEGEKANLRGSEDARRALATELVAAAEARTTTMVAGLSAEVQKKVPAALSGSERDDIKKLAESLVNDLELCGSRAAYEKHDGFMQAEVKVIDQTGAASAAPGQRYNEMAPDLIHLIHGAQKEILIQNPYVVLTEPMIQAFEDASKRGVNIRVVTNSPESTDSAVTQGFFLNDWPALLARVPTARVFVATGERKFHAKCFAIDDKISGDMSYNADLLSGRINGEIGAVSRSTEAALDLKKRIDADLTNPTNGFREWTIQKDGEGRAILDAKGQPIVTRGPEQDVSKKLRTLYGPIQLLCELLTKTDACAPLAHPPVADVLKNRDG